MLDRPLDRTGGLRGLATVPPPVSGMVCGMEPEAAAALMPRIFNLCRVAQGIGARMAFGLPPGPNQQAELQHEILREHVFAFCLKFRSHFGIGPERLPANWQTDHAAIRQMLFGAEGVMPASPREFTRFLEAGHGAAGILTRIRDCFSPFEACSSFLPTLTTDNALSACALENSVAGRQANHPVMQDIETHYGRGPFWRATARLIDAQACMDGQLPPAQSPAQGIAVVPAARGTYAVAATVEDGRVSSFRRITPTDHLVAAGGILDQTLASLPCKKSGMAPLILDILDPCMPVQLKEVLDA